jgi:hypothetical protein
MPFLGCIADDFTGSTDLAGMLVKHGMRTVQMIGVPSQTDPSPRFSLSVSPLSLPISPATAAPAPWALQKLHRICQAAFGSLDKPWWKPGYLRSAYGTVCCHKFKPKNQTDDIFLAQILGHKLLGPNASLSVGQSYKDFYIR